MKKSMPLFIVILLAILGILAFNKNGNFPKSPEINPQNNEDSKTLIPSSSSTQSEESVGKDEINLNVNYPANGIVVNQSSITVKGTTLPGAYVFVNENEITADNQGNFSTTINLDEGENSIVVIASDEYGNNSEKELIVNYDMETQQ